MWSTSMGQYAKPLSWRKGFMYKHLFLRLMSDNNQAFVSMQVIFEKRDFVAYILNSIDLSMNLSLLNFKWWKIYNIFSAYFNLCGNTRYCFFKNSVLD